MNIKQQKELKDIDDCYGVADEVKEKLHQLDQKGQIKPHFSIRPILHMVVDNVEFNNETYREYEEEYE